MRAEQVRAVAWGIALAACFYGIVAVVAIAIGAVL